MGDHNDLIPMIVDANDCQCNPNDVFAELGFGVRPGYIADSARLGRISRLDFSFLTFFSDCARKPCQALLSACPDESLS